MSTYAIGDIQGCFSALEKLLTHINFNAENDTLWFAGDIVNRGSQSLEVLRFIKQLGAKHITVLGNHDLHLLAVAFGVREQRQHDTLSAILTAPDRDELLDWLRQRPLIHFDKQKNFLLVHAGIANAWSVEQAVSLSQEVEHALQNNPKILLNTMYGDQPEQWSTALTGADRLRCIINYCTRMRFCHRDGRLDLSYKGEIKNKPADLIPWFEMPDLASGNVNIAFGHWAALNGETNAPHVFALDTGCAWGHCLTALRLEDQQRFSIKC